MFKSVGFTRSKADQCLLILLVFVDDILVARADEDAEFCQQKVKAIQANSFAGNSTGEVSGTENPTGS